MVDLDELIKQDTDPPGKDIPFPDRLPAVQYGFLGVNQTHPLYHGVPEGRSGYRINS